MSLFRVGTTASGVTIARDFVKDALKAQAARRGRDFVIGIGLQYKGEITSDETRGSTLGVFSSKQAMDNNRIQKRRHRATQGYPKVHSQGHRLAAVDAGAGRAALVEGINDSPELACHAFVSKASKKGVVHNTVIRLAPVEEEKTGELTPLHARAHRGIKSKQGIGRSAPMPETVLVIVELDMRAQPLKQEVAE
jgi:hypothetical protein